LGTGSKPLTRLHELTPTQPPCSILPALNHMKLPYNRPRLIEIHDQPWCPAPIRQHVQSVLTFLWLHRIPPFQSKAPYEPAADLLEQLLREIEEDESGSGASGTSGKGRLRVVDCCSGAGGPMPRIERRVK
jgi:hypothetical protein